MALRTGKAAQSQPAGSLNSVSGKKAGFSRPGARIRRIFFWRWILAVLTTIALLLAGLGFLYRPHFVHPVSTLMLMRWITAKPVDRQWVDLDDVAGMLRYSVIMSEDGQFCAHRGVDWNEFMSVVDDALSGEPTRGASTLTMQTVKNLFLWNSRSYFRKFLEIPLAIYIDALWTKNRILEVYLNIAEWGDGIFGIEAAAQHYFNVPAARLSARQSALLAAALPNPLVRNSAKPGRQHSRLASVVQKRAAKSRAYTACVR